MIGTVGHLLILVSFVAAAVSGIAYFRGSYMDTRNRAWRKIARPAWTVMTVASMTAFGILMYLAVTNQFQYAYIYENTSLDLELKYRIAATWAGQEGSFLLWILLNALVGMVVMRLVRDFEAPVMAVIALCQVFLIGMIVGLNVGALEIGASPFATLAEKFPTAPMIQAGITPTDGQGLNDLLQNYWMVIHPPILFLGFSTMIVPFAFAVAALWKKRYTDWVRPALPWALIGVLCLGVGISLGGYWAYITLSFGGYWAWDPVENASFLPWLAATGYLHSTIVQERKRMLKSWT
ncbi:MAG: cytochrome c biogenesis protein CcsA, partial [Bacteroidetes bacterium]|nr:cytochrome c biogenesis protein CcsA [Bacteroidota bacterium]